VQSPAMVTDVSAHIYPDSAGFHYCKLLSPARIMEWIYVDGLRRHDRASDQLVVGEEEEAVAKALLRGGGGAAGVALEE
jgi:hypothetical protein